MSNVILNQEEQGKQKFSQTRPPCIVPRWSLLHFRGSGFLAKTYLIVGNLQRHLAQLIDKLPLQTCLYSCRISQEPKAGCRFGSSLGYLFSLSHVIAVIWLLLVCWGVFLPVMPVQLLNLFSLQCYKKQVNPHTNVSVQCCNLITINRSFYEAVNVSSIYKYCTITAGSGVIMQSNPLSKPNIS